MPDRVPVTLPVYTELEVDAERSRVHFLPGLKRNGYDAPVALSA
jgi:hypothetical protein